MITIHYLQYKDKLDNNLYHSLLELVPEDLRNRIKNYRRWEDAHSVLFGRLLLKKSLEYHELKASLSHIKYTSFGRPFIPGIGDFNISHSGNIVACSYCTSGKVGLDLEEIREMGIEMFKAQFREEEWEVITKYTSDQTEFYRLWTAKEAVLKADGRGLFIEPKSIEIKEDACFIEGEKWFLKRINFGKGFTANVASSNIIKDIKLIRVNNVSDLESFQQ